MIRQTPDPDLVAEAARSVPGVTGLGGGPAGAVATYLPGRQVPGIRIEDDVVAVHVTATLDQPLMRVAAAVRSAVDPLVSGRRVDVVIEDVVSAPDLPRVDAPG